MGLPIAFQFLVVIMAVQYKITKRQSNMITRIRPKEKENHKENNIKRSINYVPAKILIFMILF